MTVSIKSRPKFLGKSPTTPAQGKGKRPNQRAMTRKKKKKKKERKKQLKRKKESYFAFVSLKSIRNFFFRAIRDKAALVNLI